MKNAALLQCSIGKGFSPIVKMPLTLFGKTLDNVVFGNNMI
jgi:hypothetical protein